MHKAKKNRIWGRVISAAVLCAFAISLPLTALAASQPGGNASPARAEQSPRDSEVRLDAQFFPDAQFRRWLSGSVLKGVQEGDVISQEQLDSVQYMSLVRQSIRTLQGIRYFPNLKSLFMDNGQVTTLDLTGNPNLESVECSRNPISSINVRGLKNLTELTCSYSFLISVDMDGCDALRHIDVSGNSALSHMVLPPNREQITGLLCSNTALPQLDLSECTGLEVLGCDQARLATLDLSANHAITTLGARGNQLISVHGPGWNTVPSGVEIAHQNPYTLGVSPSGGDFDLAAVDPRFERGTVTSVQGGQIDGTILRDVAPGSTVTYTYSDGGLSVDCSIQVVTGNSWVVPPSIEGWIEGEAPKEPTAVPAYGEARFSYAPAGTEDFVADPPTQPGTYVCRAEVEATGQYGSLVGDVGFVVARAQDSVPIPTDVSVPYRTQVRSISLPEGFEWGTNVPTFVGDVGERSFDAVYTRPGTSLPVECQIPVEVVPVDGTLCTISPITNEYQSKNIVITLGTYRLVKDQDYTVSSRVEGNEVDVVISFHGNFYGTATRQFTFSLENSWITQPSIEGWVAGAEPSAPKADAAYGTASFLYEVGGAWQSEPPTEPGQYVCRATVPATVYYPELTADMSFTVYRAVAPDVTGLEATYLDTLQRVALPAGFQWGNPLGLVGAVGSRSHQATYTSDGDTEYKGGEVFLSVAVGPRNGSECQISSLTNEYEARHIVITYGEYTLVSGVDYRVASQTEGNTVRISISFEGNFTGVVERSFQFGTENAWVVPLAIRGWVAGQEPSTPVADARYGTPQFSYLVNGNWQADPPSEPGQYQCRAIVPATAYYAQIEATVSFVVYEKAAPDVGTLVATYGQRLSDITLPAGFAWDSPGTYVGSVGTRTFPATYTPQEGDGLMGGPATLTVSVGPRSGLLCEISPITNQYEARTITVTDNQVVLRKGTDYQVSWTMQGSDVTIVITFQGNYVGTVTRTFSVMGENGWVIPLSISGWKEGQVPVEPIAEPLYGQATFSYRVGGSWQDFPPEAAGQYTVRATVEGTSYYNGLEDTEEFEIVAADADLPGARIVAAENSGVTIRNDPTTGRTLIGPGLAATRDGTPVSWVLSLIEAEPHDPGFELQIVDAAGTPQYASVIVCTGFKARLVRTADNRVLDQVSIAVIGDVLGTGQISLSQLVDMAREYQRPNQDVLTPIELVAGDFYMTGSITLSDLVTEARMYRENLLDAQGA